MELHFVARIKPNSITVTYRHNIKLIHEFEDGNSRFVTKYPTLKWKKTRNGERIDGNEE